MRRAALMVCLSAGLLTPPAEAQETQNIGGLALLKATGTEAASSLLSLPGADYSTRSGEAAILADGDAKGVRYRIRGEAFAYSGRETEWAVKIKELAYGRRLNEAWSVSIGKQVRSWDSGLAYQPLGFFRKGLDLADPFDSEGRVEGLPMLVVTRLGSRANLEGVVSAPLSGSSATSANERQWAVRLSGDITPSINAAWIVRQRDHAAPGVGASANWARDRLQLHADVFYGPPPVRLTSRSLHETPRLYTERPTLLQDQRKAVLDAVAGLTWTATDYFEIDAEWIHRGEGAAKTEWLSFLDQVDYHRGALSGAQAPLALANLAWDLSSIPARRDHLFVMMRLPIGRATYSLSSFFTVADASSIINARASWLLTHHTSVNLGVTAYTGANRSEFGLLPLRGAAFVSLSQPF
jgi:hypothetical protein